jgi:hypothetical protein
VSIGKSVPNLISYLHEFLQNFSKSPTICFDQISFGYFINSEIADKRAPLVSRRAPRRPARLKRCRDGAASRQRRLVPTARADRSHSRPRRPPRAAPTAPDRRLAPCAAAPTASPSPLSERAVAAVRARPVYPAPSPSPRPPSLVTAGEPTPPPRRLRAH